MRKRVVFRCVSIILVLAMVAGGAVAQSSSRASSSSSSTGGTAEVRLGGFVFETGARVALEIVHEGDSACFGSKVVVERMRLVDSTGTVLYDENLPPGTDAATWIGRVHLVGPSGAPLTMGAYEIVVSTSAGLFVAEIEVTSLSRLYGLGRYSASASVCGYSLHVYRLLTKLDDGAVVALRVGDRVMIELEGNPTTGYSWSNTLEAEFASLREIEEVEYRPSSTLIGSGGTFLFRYVAIGAGPQMLRFAYQRPWESAEPIEVVAFSIDIR